MNKYTFKQFRKAYPNDDACLREILLARYQSTCPDCGSVGVKFYKITNRKAYVCSACGEHIYPLADTIFHKSSTSIWYWFYAMYIFSVSKNGVAAKELERHLGVTYKTAWRMANRIRSLMYQDTHMFSGTVEADAAYVGGRRSPKKRYSNKVMVTGAVERGGAAMVKVMRQPNRQFITDFFAQRVAVGTDIVTDESNVYSHLAARFDHKTVRHFPMTYHAGEVHTNTIEGIWSLLKNSMTGTYHTVSQKYLQHYVDEFVFHYNRNSSVVFQDLIARACDVAPEGLATLVRGIYLVYRTPDEEILSYDWPASLQALLPWLLVREKPRPVTWLDDVLRA